MSKPDPVRIHDARKAATIERLVGEGVPRPWVDQWIASYEGGDADMHRVFADPAGFWENAYQFTRGEYDRGHHPPPPPDTSSDDRDPAL